MEHDPFGRAIRDYHRGEQDEALVDRDGAETREHPIEEFYFGAFEPESESGAWLTSWLDGPLLDMGAGAGRDTLYFQEHFETVAIEPSASLVETMRDRGVRDARVGDMFTLRESFERDRFQSALAIGTQMGLAGSIQGLRRFLGNLAFVTTPDASAVLDGYDPSHESEDLIGYRADPKPGLAHRVLHFEYDGDVGETLHFRLFSPDRVREAAVGTGWAVVECRSDAGYYRLALTKA